MDFFLLSYTMKIIHKMDKNCWYTSFNERKTHSLHGNNLNLTKIRVKNYYENEQMRSQTLHFSLASTEGFYLNITQENDCTLKILLHNLLMQSNNSSNCHRNFCSSKQVLWSTPHEQTVQGSYGTLHNSPMFSSFCIFSSIILGYCQRPKTKLPLSRTFM